jgi:hypothetical protein
MAVSRPFGRPNFVPVRGGGFLKPTETKQSPVFGSGTIESILPSINVALYVRIGTLYQNASLQRDELRAYCGRRALKVVGEYQDTMSGAKDSRPTLQRLAADTNTSTIACSTGEPTP